MVRVDCLGVSWDACLGPVAMECPLHHTFQPDPHWSLCSLVQDWKVLVVDYENKQA